MTYTVCDHDGDSDTATATITVTGQNDAPVIDTANSASTADGLTVNEGSPLTITDLVTFSDIDLTDFATGATEDWSITIAWGDGTTSTLTKAGLVNAGGNTGDTVTLTLDTAGAANLGSAAVPTPNIFSVDGTHTFIDDNPTGTNSDPYAVMITVNDGNGGTATHSLDVTVNNVDPTIPDLAVTSPHNEAGEAALSGTVTDPAGTGETFTLTVNWDNTNNTEGAAENFVLDGTAKTKAADGYDWNPTTRAFTVYHTYVDDNPTATASDVYNIGVTLTDDDFVNPGSTAFTGTVQTTINNVAPDITVGGTDSAAETLTEDNAPLSVSGTLSVADPGDLDPVNATVDAGVGITGNAGGLSVADLEAMFSLTSTNPVIAGTAGSTTGTINWNFDSGAESFDHLAAGETLQLTYTVRAADDDTGTDTQTVIITINGANDPPVAVNDGTFEKVWQLGIDNNLAFNASEFAHEGQPDEHYYFAGSYAARLDGNSDLIPTTNEDFKTFDRAQTNTEPNDFIHFNLGAGQLNDEFRIVIDTQNNAIPAGQSIGFEVLFNGVSVYTDTVAAGTGTSLHFPCFFRSRCKCSDRRQHH